MSEHEHEFSGSMKASRLGLWKWCRTCSKWIQTIDTGWSEKLGGEILGAEVRTFQSEMDELRYRCRELGRDILEAAGIPRLVAWLDMMILRWRLMRNIRRHHRRKDNQ